MKNQKSFEKKAYESPVLEDLGDAETITRGFGAGFGDAGGGGLQETPQVS